MVSLSNSRSNFFEALAIEEQHTVSSIIFTVILVFVLYQVQQGEVNFFHIHDQVHRTHSVKTVAAVLQLLFTALTAYYHDDLLIFSQSKFGYPNTPKSDGNYYFYLRQNTIILHFVAWLSAHGMAFTYKVLVLLYKVYRYRSLTKYGLTGENRKMGTTPKRILIVHASVGSGHKRAAQAVRESLKAKYEKEKVECIIETIDVVDTMQWFLKAVYKDGFMTLVTKDWGAAFIGLMFDMSNRSAPGVKGFGSTGFIQTLTEEMFLLSFVEAVFNFKPDVIVNTHFLPTKVLSHMRLTIKAFEIPHVTVVTDYDVHAYWGVNPCEQFFVARDECRHMLESFGVPKANITITGMPVVRDFSHNLPTREECLNELKLDGSVPVILLMAGGDDIKETFTQLLSMKTPIQIALVCGRYEKKKKMLEKVIVPKHHKVKIEGFTKLMHYYLQAADIIITKPGGLTTAESLATGTCMAIFHSLPGQEMRNADMILEEGAGFKISDTKMLSYKIEKVISNKALLEKMKTNAKRIGNTTAASVVADFVFKGMY